MKKSKFISVLISAVLVAFMAALVLCMSFGNVSETAYNAKAEESATEQPEGEQEGSQRGETEQGGETPAGMTCNSIWMLSSRTCKNMPIRQGSAMITQRR